MSSVLTNVSALTALQSLSMTQKALQNTQSQISTGLKIASASDNASYWSIATTMKSDNGALDAVSSALAESASSIDVATAALNSTIDVLNSMKTQLITARNPGTDVGAVNTQLSALSDQLNSVTQGASFNGLNYLDGSLGLSISAVSGFHRSGTGSVGIDTFQIDLQSLNSAATAATTVAGNDIEAGTGQFTSVAALVDNSSAVSTAVYGADKVVIAQAGSGWATGDTALVTSVDVAGNKTATTYTFIAGATPAQDKFTTSITSTPAGGSGSSILVQGSTDTTKLGSGSGRTAATIANASTLEAAVDAAIKAVTTYSAQLGSTKSQITQQQTFVSNLSSSLTAGIGSLIDADMNEASTKLQALQTQQQLGIQSLSMANQNSQLILKLFGGG